MFKYQYDISSFIAYDIYRAIMYNLIKTTETKRKTGRFYNHDRTGPATGKLAGPVPVRRSGSYSDCTCPPDFRGKHCEQDRRVCKLTTCLNNGTCHNISKTDFNCSCASGWEGKRCERIINLCSSSPCQNRGVCFPSLRNYTCKCLQGSYSGRHCEITATRIQVLQVVSTSFAYIAIIAMVTVVMFVLIMDILKYCFGIDPVEDERERLRRKKYAKKRKPPVIQRFTYVNK